eukprot:scaffold79225_cov20-Tisochrysis_lutea.AAC.2
MCLWEPGADRIVNLATAITPTTKRDKRKRRAADPNAVLEAVCLWGLHTPVLRSVAPVRCKLLVPSFTPAEMYIHMLKNMCTLDLPDLCSVVPVHCEMLVPSFTAAEASMGYTVPASGAQILFVPVLCSIALIHCKLLVPSSRPADKSTD